MKPAVVGRGAETLVAAHSSEGLVALSELARRGGIPLPAGLSSARPDPAAVAADEAPVTPEATLRSTPGLLSEIERRFVP